MTIIVTIQLILALLLIILVLLQGSDNEGLGLGGGSSSLGGMMTIRGSANLLSRLTALTATLFMAMSLILTIYASVVSEKKVLEALPLMEENTSIESNNTEPSIPNSN